MGISDPKALIVYSSPAGTTRHVAQVIENTLKDLGYKYGVTDLGNKDDCLNINSKVKDLVTDHCLWVGTPVYTGHAVPQVTRFISELPESKGSCAVPFVTWGGVSSGLALYEMGRGLSEKGYTVLGAAKVLAVHSLMWQFKSPLGEGHPDAEEDSMIKGLVGEIDAKLLSDVIKPLSIENLNYQPKKVQESMQNMSIEVAKQILPGKELDAKVCNQCGDCEEICPAQAIRCNPYPQFGDECFLCYNCVRLCKVEAIKSDLSKMEGMLRGMADDYAEQPLSQVFV